MASRRFPEGYARLTIGLPVPVKVAVERVATENHQTTSSLIGAILENWLKAQGQLPMRSASVEVTA